MTSVYDQAHAIEEAYSTWHALQRDGKLADASEFRMENLDLINAYQTVESIKSSIAKINQQIRLVERSDSDGNVKRDEIRKLNARKDQLAKTLTH